MDAGSIPAASTTTKGQPFTAGLSLPAGTHRLDVTSRPPTNTDGSAKPNRHLEVKERSKDQNTITLSRNEIIYDLVDLDKFIIAIMIVEGDASGEPYCVKTLFPAEPDFGIASINHGLSDPLSKEVKPEQTL